MVVQTITSKIIQKKQDIAVFAAFQKYLVFIYSKSKVNILKHHK